MYEIGAAKTDVTGGAETVKASAGAVVGASVPLRVTRS